MKTGSRVRPIILVILGVVVCLSLALTTGPAFSQDDGCLGSDDLWWDGFVPHGPLGALDHIGPCDILSGTVHEGSLIVGGQFRHLDGVPVPGLARWAGTTWEAVDATGLALDPRELAVYQGMLIAGGELDGYAPDARSCLYRQTDSGWEPFGPDTLRVDQTGVARIKVAGDNLYVLAIRPFPSGGLYTDRMVYIVARWDGTAWTLIDAMGDLEQRQSGFIIFQDIDEFRGDPVVAGYFHLEDGDTNGYVARWTGSTLEYLGAGTDDPVRRLAVLGDRLIVAGSFDKAGGVPTGPVAAWDGQSWGAVGERLGLEDGGRATIRDMERCGDDLVVWGHMDRIGSTPTGSVATWDGTVWRPTEVDSADDVQVPPSFVAETADGLFFAGDFYYGTHRTPGLAHFENSRWAPFPYRGVELFADPTCALATQDGVVVAGEFTLPGRLAATNGIARWDGAGWHLLARDLDESIRALIEYEGRLVAGGSFTAIDGVEAGHIAILENGRWEQVGNGLNDSVFALEVYDGRLVAGGEFTASGSRTVERIAVWDGLSWQQLGGGIQGGIRDYVRDLEVYGGELYAGGHFNWADDSWVDLVARWDGHSWSRAGDIDVFEGGRTYSPWVSHLEVWNGRLVASGRFQAVQGLEASSIATWDGEAWSPLTPLIEGDPGVLCDYQGRLVVGGRIACQDGGISRAGLLLAYDGAQWSTLGSGLTIDLGELSEGGSVSDLVEWQGHLFAVGHFYLAGGKLSKRIARWDGAGLAPLPVPRLRAAPNPAREHSAIAFHLDGPGQTAVRVFDIQGRRVRTLHDGFMTGGDHTATWDLRSDTGRRVPAGVYFLRVDSPFARATEKVVVIR